MMTTREFIPRDTFEAKLFDAMVLAGLHPGMLHEWSPGHRVPRLPQGVYPKGTRIFAVDTAYGVTTFEVSIDDDAMKIADAIAQRMAEARQKRRIDGSPLARTEPAAND